MDKVSEAHYAYCGVASCGGPDSFFFSAHMIFHILGIECCSTATFSYGAAVINEWRVLSTLISAVTSIKLPSGTANTSICNTESSDLTSNLSGMVYANCREKGKKKSPQGTVQLWNDHAHRFGTEKNWANVFLSF